MLWPRVYISNTLEELQVSYELIIAISSQIPALSDDHVYVCLLKEELNCFQHFGQERGIDLYLRVGVL